MIKVAIADDKLSYRNILKEKIQRTPELEIVMVSENGVDFLEQMAELPVDRLPSVVLMDLEMPQMDGVDAVAAGSYLYPDVKFVMLTTFDDEEKIFKAIKAGASGYLLKDESSENITDTILQMHENGTGPVSPGIAYKILQLVQNNTMSFERTVELKEKTLFRLTDREMEILKLLVQGLLYKEIGDRLSISPNTAKKHVMNIYSKLHVNNKIQALDIAYKKGLL